MHSEYNKISQSFFINVSAYHRSRTGYTQGITSRKWSSLVVRRRLFQASATDPSGPRVWNADTSAASLPRRFCNIHLYSP